jgi:hypothetical protein
MHRHCVSVRVRNNWPSCPTASCDNCGLRVRALCCCFCLCFGACILAPLLGLELMARLVLWQLMWLALLRIVEEVVVLECIRR